MPASYPEKAFKHILLTSSRVSGVLWTISSFAGLDH